MLGNLSNCIAPSNLHLSSNSITTARTGTVEAFFPRPRDPGDPRIMRKALIPRSAAC